MVRAPSSPPKKVIIHWLTPRVEELLRHAGEHQQQHRAHHDEVLRSLVAGEAHYQPFARPGQPPALSHLWAVYPEPPPRVVGLSDWRLRASSLGLSFVAPLCTVEPPCRMDILGS